MASRRWSCDSDLDFSGLVAVLPTSLRGSRTQHYKPEAVTCRVDLAAGLWPSSSASATSRLRENGEDVIVSFFFFSFGTWVTVVPIRLTCARAPREWLHTARRCRP